jgi:hypothetical protein
LRNVLRNPEDLAIVFADEFVVRRDVPGLNPLYEGNIGVRLVFVRYGLDGRHGSWLRGILRGVARRRPTRLSVIDGRRRSNEDFRSSGWEC